MFEQRVKVLNKLLKKKYLTQELIDDVQIEINLMRLIILYFQLNDLYLNLGIFSQDQYEKNKDLIRLLATLLKDQNIREIKERLEIIVNNIIKNGGLNFK